MNDKAQGVFDACLFVNKRPVAHSSVTHREVSLCPVSHPSPKHFVSAKVWKYEKGSLTLFYKVLYMDSQHPPLQTIQDIKRMMERSSRFISLSGWSGVSAGICALGGAYAANTRLNEHHDHVTVGVISYEGAQDVFTGLSLELFRELIWIAAITFIAAFISAFFFTWLRSRKNKTPLWDRTVQRLAWNTVLPLAAGAVFLYRSMEMDHIELVAPGCLIFYGLALVNASKYTLGEIRFLGYGQIILGLANLWLIDYGLYFWAAGFGVLHILYGMVMWWRYERVSSH